MKRSNPSGDDFQSKKLRDTARMDDEVEHDELFDDEFEEEEIVNTAEQEEKLDADALMERELAQHNNTKEAWIPGMNTTDSNETLEYDPEAYALYHKMKVEWPSLSFSILPDALGTWRQVSKPVTMYAVTGSQADLADKNRVSILKMSNLRRMHHESDEGSLEEQEDADSEDEDDILVNPIVDARYFNHPGTVNRLRHCPQFENIISTWSDNGKVYAWDIKPYAAALENKTDITAKYRPLYEFSGHSQEGYAMDWSTINARLATGSCDGTIFTHSLKEDIMGKDGGVIAGHTGSVEDIQWSPSEATVLATCSTDRTIKIWDTRQRSRAAITVQAHSSDVNVLSWNRKISYLIATGGDDGALKIWDLRMFKPNTMEVPPAAHFSWHKKPITSIEWHPQEDSVLACSSEDNSITVWDMALEADPEEVAKESTGAKINYDIPPQLLFIHSGQEHIKEIHFHPQIPSLLVSTAYDGIDIFKAANLDIILPPSANTA